MRRLLTLLAVCVVLTGILCIPASAETSASKVDLYCTVTADGDCQVSMTVTLRLEEAHDQMTFPLPANAKNITMNHSSASTTKTDSAIEVDISKITKGYVGEASLFFEYTIPEAVKVSADQSSKLIADRTLQLDIPLLCGFEYPVESLTFLINMPSDKMTNSPSFHSIYRQASIESDLTFKVDKNQIIGSSKTTLHDHEGITMTMIVPQSMFPTVSTYIREGNPEIVPMIICAVIALLYWILFLRTLPMFRIRTSTPPEGITAGEMGCRLTLAGGDLTMMVFSWAQLGYLLIHMDGNGRVLLYKRMEMGNERSAFENKIFKALFSSRRVVDATGNQYALLCQKVAKQVPNERNMHKGNSGNMKLFRFIACGSQVFCGICVAMNMTSISFLQILLAVILGLFGAVSSWLIQDVAYRTHLRGKTPVYIGLVCILLWIALGLLCGQVWIPLCCSLGEFVLGYFAAYGGRRSDLGRHDAGMVLGFRNYAKHLPREDISRLMKNDPDYFFNLAPYALALGVIRPFSEAFGRRKLDQCPYLVTRVHGKRTAQEWGKLMADAADMMDARVRRMQVEKWLAVQLPVVKIQMAP
ncbi:MAG: DUF2207 family protein, partial [Faecousia sp.]